MCRLSHAPGNVRGHHRSHCRADGLTVTVCWVPHMQSKPQRSSPSSVISGGQGNSTHSPVVGQRTPHVSWSAMKATVSEAEASHRPGGWGYLEDALGQICGSFDLGIPK